MLSILSVFFIKSDFQNFLFFFFFYLSMDKTSFYTFYTISKDDGVVTNHHFPFLIFYLTKNIKNIFEIFSTSILEVVMLIEAETKFLVETEFSN